MLWTLHKNRAEKVSQKNVLMLSRADTALSRRCRVTGLPWPEEPPQSKRNTGSLIIFQYEMAHFRRLLVQCYNPDQEWYECWCDITEFKFSQYSKRLQGWVEYNWMGEAQVDKNLKIKTKLNHRHVLNTVFAFEDIYRKNWSSFIHAKSCPSVCFMYNGLHF